MLDLRNKNIFIKFVKKNIMKTVSFLIFTSLLFFSCNNNVEKDSQNKQSGSMIAADNMSEEELAKNLEEYQREEELRIENEKNSMSSMTIDKEMHDFGTIKPETDNTCRFKVTNTGNKPLIIKDVKASCGCTTPHKPEGPIAPGASDFIEVGFHPSAKQLNEIIKTVTITANIPESSQVVRVRAYVKE